MLSPQLEYDAAVKKHEEVLHKPLRKVLQYAALEGVPGGTLGPFPHLEPKSPDLHLERNGVSHWMGNKCDEPD